MRVNGSVKRSGFKPIELNITIESAEEAKALYAIFNYTHTHTT